jgi:hypothetical protein
LELDYIHVLWLLSRIHGFKDSKAAKPIFQFISLIERVLYAHKVQAWWLDSNKPEQWGFASESEAFYLIETS